MKRANGSSELCDSPRDSKKTLCPPLPQKAIWRYIMKLFSKSRLSANVTETLLPYFLDCRQVFKEQIQSFIHYKNELFIFVLKTELVFFNIKSDRRPNLYSSTCLHIFFNVVSGF